MNKKLLCLLISSFYYQAVQTSKKSMLMNLQPQETHKKRLNTRKKFCNNPISSDQQNNGLIQRQLLKSR